MAVFSFPFLEYIFPAIFCRGQTKDGFIVDLCFLGDDLTCMHFQRSWSFCLKCFV